MTQLSPSERRALEQKVEAGKRLLRLKQARENLLPFIEVTMPDPLRYEDPTASRYEAQPHHRFLAEAMEKVARGETLRLLLSVYPQSGKSELVTHRFLPWIFGRFPTKNWMFGSYNQDFAEEKGQIVRSVIQSDQYRAIFPEIELVKGSKAKDAMTNTFGGSLRFLGRGGSGTGFPADGWVLDDVLKNAEEADSPTTREHCWQWLTRVVFTRMHLTSFLVVMATRWHDDDIIGRLTDANNPNYDKKIADEFTVINIPAIMNEEWSGKLGIPVGEALWAKRHSLKTFDGAKRLNARAFQCMYMGSPAPEEGDFFRREWMKGYKQGALPSNLRIYGASDHALGTKQQNDRSVLGSVGIDESGVVWILPTLQYGKWQSDELVEKMLHQFRGCAPEGQMIDDRRPLLWWAEDENIKKAIGPFLRKRMIETQTYTTLDPITPTKDLKRRAASIQGRMQNGMVRFPLDADWWPWALDEMLKFRGEGQQTHDDFIAWLALIGLGLDRMASASKVAGPANDDREPPGGTMAWFRYQAKREQRLASTPGGW